MPNKTLLMPSISRVAAGSVATLEYPLGPTYLKTIITAGGTGLAIADFGRINLKIDGQVVMTWKDLQRLMDMNIFWARGTDTVNEFAIHFFRRELMNIIAQRAPGLGTADVQTMVLEIELLSTAPADVTLTAHSELDPTRQPLGVFVKIKEFPYSSAVSGDVEIDKLLKGPWYAAAHLFKADISKVVVEMDEGQGPVKWVDATKAILERNQKEAAPRARVPVTAKATHIDFLTEGDLYKALKTDKATDLRIKMTLDTAGAVDIITETLDILGG